MKKCKNCKGTGEIKFYSHVRNGVCFRCEGTGVVLTKAEREAIRRKREEKKRQATINDLKMQLAILYNQIHYGWIKSEKYKEMRRKEARKIWARLKEMGEKPTLEEIEQISAKLRAQEETTR